ncbi:phosphorylcholine transferase LicD [Cohnella sp. GbtcB17]|uniref:LicD family protein n=1 Tax=Cohnella sp. GbtcB17 TaxID=2824762 RepID=UPI001C30A57A|nr:LicD family protein [Cohnella sp. GbtcB17]
MQKYSQQEMSQAELRQMQLIQVELLAEFDALCRKHGLRYIIASGTLLGAVRHGAFIPWDDDIDVEMLRSDYDKLCRIDKREFGANTFLQTYKTDKHYPWLYGKLRRTGTQAVRLGQEHMKMHSGVFIDIFPRDGVPNNGALRAARGLVATVCRKILYSRAAYRSSTTFMGRLGWSVVRFIPKQVAFGMAKILSVVFAEQRADRVGCIGYHGKAETNGFRKDWFTELVTLPFEGGMYFAPADWDGYLRYVYGEGYQTPPPPNRRSVTSPLSFYSLGHRG